MVERNEGFGFPINNSQQVPASPQVVAFAFDKLPRRFTRLFREFRLLIANPAQL